MKKNIFICLLVLLLSFSLFNMNKGIKNQSDNPYKFTIEDFKPNHISINLQPFFKTKENSVINVKSYGASGNGITDDTLAIQKAIDASPPQSLILFPPGTYIISSTLKLKDNRVYSGAGWNTILKQKDNTNLVYFIQLENSSKENFFQINNLLIDGNRDKNSGTVGLYLQGITNSIISQVKVINFPGTGMWMEASTNRQGGNTHLIDCWTYNNGGYGIFSSQFLKDMHISGGDQGNNDYANIFIASPSSSIRDTIIWGSKYDSGLIIEKNAPSVQIIDNNIEGNAKDGILIKSSHVLITGNKIYDNSNVKNSYGKYDGINLDGSPNNIVQNTLITGNIIYNGLYQNTGYYNCAINLGDYHENSVIQGNSIKYSGNGAKNNKVIVNGISKDKGDYVDFSWKS